MADAAVTIDGLQAFEVALQFTTQIPLDEGTVIGDDVNNLRDLLRGKILSAGVRID